MTATSRSNGRLQIVMDDFPAPKKLAGQHIAKYLIWRDREFYICLFTHFLKMEWRRCFVFLSDLAYQPA